MQKFEHFGAKIKNRPKSSLRTFLHGALQIEWICTSSRSLHNADSMIKINACCVALLTSLATIQVELIMSS